MQQVPGHLANPVWVDDENFDLGYHVRRSALPRPGSTDQLLELVSRIVSRPLDRQPAAVGDLLRRGAGRRPGGAALQDPPGAGRRRRDRRPRPGAARQGPRGEDPRRRRVVPAPAPLTAGLLAGALHDTVTERETALDTVRHAVGSALRTADRSPRAPAGSSAGSPAAVPTAATRSPASSPSSAGSWPSRPRLADYRKIREAHGGTVNDVILATVTGALRAWLMTRAESMGGLRQVHAVVPVSVIDRELEATSLGSQIAAHFVDLPVGEASPVVRLHQVSYSFQAHKETGRGGRRQPAGRASPASRRRRSTRSARGSPPPSCAAASSSRSPTCPDRSRRSTPPARGCCAPSRSRRCCRARRWPSA